MIAADRVNVSGPGAASEVDVSVIVPTYDEAENLPTLIERLTAVLAEYTYEIIVVDDDSPDQTWRIAKRLSVVDPRIRLLRRIGQRGLSSAVLEGMDMACGTALAVMDADLQHDEAILPRLIEPVLGGDADVAVGSREVPGGSYGNFGRGRKAISIVGARIASGLLGVGLADPMSGFFVLSRSRYGAIRPEMSPKGFKILLEVVARGERPVVTEVGFRFRSRRRGETKLSSRVAVSYIWSVFELATAKRSSLTFLSYLAVAMTAFSVRLSLSSLVAIAGLTGGLGFAAIELAILAEYFGHQRFTFDEPEPPRFGSIARLMRFHGVALVALFGQAGVGALLGRALAGDPVVGLRLVPIYAVMTVAMMAIITLAYQLNRRITWPAEVPAEIGPATTDTKHEQRPAPTNRSADPSGATSRDRSSRASDQLSRPMTPSTSNAISSTAER